MPVRGAAGVLTAVRCRWCGRRWRPLDRCLHAARGSEHHDRDRHHAFVTDVLGPEVLASLTGYTSYHLQLAQLATELAAPSSPHVQLARIDMAITGRVS